MIDHDNMQLTHEPPCEDTGKGCRWIWCCDTCGGMFCLDCYRSREWELEEYEQGAVV